MKKHLHNVIKTQDNIDKIVKSKAQANESRFA